MDKVGGLFRNDVVELIKRLTDSANRADVPSVVWEWYDISKGLVEWTFSNPTDKTVSVMLFRNAYYFGNAFWPIYLNNKIFNTGFVDTHVPEPLTDLGVVKNSPPLAVMHFSDGTNIVAFVFTLAPGQTWSMLEGGFSPSMYPINAHLVPLTYNGTSSWSIEYDPAQVSDWDAQTGTTLQGYTPNPKQFDNTGSFNVDPSALPVSLFKDSIIEIQTEPKKPPSPNEPPQPPCREHIKKAAALYKKGNLYGAISELWEYFDCTILRDFQQ